jgi:hypothetical protein
MDPIGVVNVFGVAWAVGDPTAAVALTTDDCIIDNTSFAPDGTSDVGRDSIRLAWQPRSILDDLSAQFDAEETFAAGDRVVQLWRYTWAIGHVRGVDVFRVRDGLVAEKRSSVMG